MSKKDTEAQLKTVLFFAVVALKHFGANQTFFLSQHASRRRI
jgi:hypothetical protein